MCKWGFLLLICAIAIFLTLQFALEKEHGEIQEKWKGVEAYDPFEYQKEIICSFPGGPIEYVLLFGSGGLIQNDRELAEKLNLVIKYLNEQFALEKEHGEIQEKWKGVEAYDPFEYQKERIEND